jgi:hypothetical protein
LLSQHREDRPHPWFKRMPEGLKQGLRLNGVLPK